VNIAHFEEAVMKRVLSIACLSLALAVSLAAQATPTQAPGTIATDADYSTHMKEIGQLNGMLGKAIKGGMAEDAAKSAARLEMLFKNIHGYWSDKKIADAAMAAQSILTALAEVQKAALANDLTAAETARAKIGANCMSCHTAHREKLPEGGFRIK
jgi:cytochrome c556